MRVNPTVFYGKDIETVRILVAMAGCDKKGMILVPMDQLGEEYQVKPTRSAS
jgi:hypothetical protein